jgi:catechol 2,3-dioxygenase-like lactoylglutathione lyase family enzyme
MSAERRLLDLFAAAFSPTIIKKRGVNLANTNPEPIVDSPFSSWKADHVGLRSSDFDSAVSWYRQHFDFRLMSHWEIKGTHYGYLSPATDDASRIELIAGPEIHNRPNTDPSTGFGLAGWHHLCFRVTDVANSIGELRRRGVQIVMEPTEVKDANIKFALFSDPWGNVFEVVQALR